MPSTSRGYPYPVPADPADVPADIQAAVAAIDSDVAACVPDLTLDSFGGIGALISGAYSSCSVGSANRALVATVLPRQTVTPTEFCWWCNTQSGNYDLAIIDIATRSRLWSLGSTACPATGPVVDAIVAGPTLTAGTRYGLVFAADNNTLQLDACPISNTGMDILYDGTYHCGYVSASFPVPATLAAWSAYTYLPAMALRA